MHQPLYLLSAHLVTGLGAFDLLRGTAAEFAGSGWQRQSRRGLIRREDWNRTQWLASEATDGTALQSVVHFTAHDRLDGVGIGPRPTA